MPAPAFGRRTGFRGSSTGERAIREAVLAGVPYFGVCFGVQLLADGLGGRNFRRPEPELGVNQVFLTAAARHDPVFRGFPADLEVCEWHSNHFSLPTGAVRLARSPRYENQAIRYGRVAYGIQCHLEPSLEDIRDWLAEFPDTAVALEQRHGAGSVDRVLEDYAEFVPFLQETGRQVFARWLENALAYGRVAESPHTGAPRRLAGTPGVSSLVGRHPELARIETVLASARRGESAVLVVRGEPGVGKSSLLEAAAGSARGLRVLRTSGEDASVADTPFRGLAELLRPLADAFDGLPTPRADAVAAILGHAAKPLGQDRFALYAGALDLLVTSAARSPLLLLVDDLHLLDEESVEALSFVARHLGTDGVALLVATESDADMPGAEVGVYAGAWWSVRAHEELRLAGLAVHDAHALLRGSAGDDLAPSVADRIVDLSEGNPLALLELPVDLTPEQRAGAAQIDPSLGTTAEWAYLRRVATLSAPVRQALLVMALAGAGNMQVVAAAVEALGLEPHTVAAAQAGGLLVSDNGRQVFRHPLARVSVAYSALRADRLAAHAALAEVLEGDPSTWHKARAARRPDESVAAAVEVLAVKARDHGAFAAAARSFERASRLTPGRERRAARLLEAGRAAHAAGHVTAALDHVDAALRTTRSDPVRRDSEHLRGRIVARSGAAEVARDQLVAGAARCERDAPDAAAEMLADAVLPALRAGGPAEAVRIARRASRLVQDRGGRANLSVETALGIALTFAGEYEEGVACIKSAAESVGAADPQQRAYLGLGLLLAGRQHAARDVLARLVDQARAAGAVSTLPYALVRLADAQLDTGEWTAAAAALQEARRLARETGQVADYGLALGTLGWLDAACGREEDCRAHVDEALALAERLGSGSRFGRAATALAMLELGSGRLEQAIDHLEGICRQHDEQGWSDAAVTPHCRAELIEAYVLAGRERDARVALDRFERDAVRTQRPTALAAVARCRALLAEEGDLEDRFAEALSRAACAGPFEEARTGLLYGNRLLGIGRVDEASSVYAHALATFERLGAEPWAAHARAGIVAAGETPEPARPRVIDRLSDRELEVALACAEGGSSRDIAERLFLGLRTVELQLASATIKLGLKSTADLGEVLRGDIGTAVPEPA